jgi:uncharacterized protein YcbK (DUF882 family)
LQLSNVTPEYSSFFGVRSFSKIWLNQLKYCHLWEKLIKSVVINTSDLFSFSENGSEYNGDHMSDIKNIDRRMALKMVSGASVSGLLLPARRASATNEKQLSFYHTHTRQDLDVTYARDGHYIDSALGDINRFLSDFRSHDSISIDTDLLDLIYDIRETLGSTGRYEVISAYRSPNTNEMLRTRSNDSGVAKKSQHLLGKAIDVRLDDVKLTKLRDAALEMQRGGVGFYKESNFVHIDTGRVRRW